MQRLFFVVACAVLVPALSFVQASAQAGGVGTVGESSGDTLSLSLGEAYQRALSQSPAYLADRQELEIARGQLAQVRVLTFNPEFEYQAPGIVGSGILGEYQASLSQEIEIGGQRNLRVRAATLGVERAQSVVQNAARQTLADVGQAFYTALAAQRRVDVARELFALNEQLLTATRIQVREGEISTMDANLAEIEAGRGRARVLATEREATSARLELQRLTNVPADQFVRLEESEAVAAPLALGVDSLVQLAFSRRPDLTAQARATAQSETLTRLAQKEAVPNLRFGLFLEREELNFLSTSTPGAPPLQSRRESPRLGIGVSLPLPIFQRNRGLVAERAAQAQQSQYLLQAAEQNVRVQVTDAVLAYRSASNEAEIFEREVLATARANQELLDIAYRAGKVGLPTILLLRNQLLDAELGYWDAWLAERRALVELQAATSTLDGDFDLNLTGTP